MRPANPIEPEVPIQEIVKKVRHLQIRARKLVNEQLQSDYHSVFKGQGIEFNDVRPYNPGDDIRSIDWKVTARMNQAFTRTYIEERQLRVLFALDISGSTRFGSRSSKRQMMAEITAMLGFASFFNHDQTGLILFHEDIEKILPPARHQSSLLRLIRDAWYYPASRRGTNIRQSLLKMSNVLKKRSVIFLMSDFLDEGYKTALGNLCRRHDVIPIVIQDRLENTWELPRKLRWPVLADLQDLEDGSISTVSLPRATHIEKYRDYYRTLFRSLGLDFLEADDQSDYLRQLEILLRQRMRRK